MADTWYYSSEGRAVGPHSFDEIKRMAAAGGITARDHVCSDGKTWQLAAEIAGLEFGVERLGYQSREAKAALLTPRAVGLLQGTSV